MSDVKKELMEEDVAALEQNAENIPEIGVFRRTALWAMLLTILGSISMGDPEMPRISRLRSSPLRHDVSA